MFFDRNSFRTATLIRRTLFLMLIAIFSSGIGVLAQNNPYKINDKLYPAFIRLIKSTTSPACLHLADSLYAEAEKLGDHKAQVAILCTPIQYALNSKNTSLMESLVARTLKESLKYGYPQYYFYAEKMQVSHYLNLTNFVKAKQLLEKMELDAKTLFNGYGEFICYQQYGTYYQVLRNDAKAVEYYLKALDTAKRKHPDQDNESIYTALAKSYRYLGQKEKALEILDEGLANIKDHNVLPREFRLLDAKCFTLYDLQRYDEAEKVYQLLHSEKFLSLNRKNSNAIYNDIFHLIYTKKFDEAIELAQSIQTKNVRFSWMSQIEQARGNKDLALSLYITAYDQLKRSTEEQRQQDFARANAELGNHLLETQNAELRLKSNELALHNAQLSIEKQKNELALQRSISEKNRLALTNRELSIDRLRTELNEQNSQKKLRETEYQRLSAESRSRNIISVVSILFFVLIIIWLVSYLILRRRSIAALHRKNKELSEALHRAEESEKTKMRFLQNMSHEIRTPLNAIVGFSQLLVHQQDTDDFTDEQKQEFIDLVDQNTENLTNLIDDILSLSALEHGTTMKISLTQCKVNAICHSALASVKHRCPDGINLYYTTEVDDDFTIVCDSHRLQQVIINYLTNAEKHTQAGEIHLHTSLSENPGKITFSVTDTGEGVPKEMAESIFNRFEKLDSFVQGTGLGLNICRMIATHLNGVVKLDTTHTGPGARFVFILPLEQPTPPRKSTP